MCDWFTIIELDAELYIQADSAMRKSSDNDSILGERIERFLDQILYLQTMPFDPNTAMKSEEVNRYRTQTDAWREADLRRQHQKNEIIRRREKSSLIAKAKCLGRYIAPPPSFPDFEEEQ